MQFWFARKVTVCPRGRNGAKRRVLLENVSRSFDPAEHPRTRRIRKKMRTAAAKLQVLGVRSETASFRTAAAKLQVLGVRSETASFRTAAAKHQVLGVRSETVETWLRDCAAPRAKL
jgi:hypothetical protein